IIAHIGGHLVSALFSDFYIIDNVFWIELTVQFIFSKPPCGIDHPEPETDRCTNDTCNLDPRPLRNFEGIKDASRYRFCYDTLSQHLFGLPLEGKSTRSCHMCHSITVRPGSEQFIC